MKNYKRKTEAINRPEAKAKIEAPTLAPWQMSESGFTTGSGAICELQEIRHTLDCRWGVGRLRLLAAADLREKFDRQAIKLNRAERVGTLDELTAECARMQRAWGALEKAALAAGHAPTPPADLWEVMLPDGRLLVLCRTDDELLRQRSVPGRQAWSLEEVARLVSAQDAGLLGLKGRFGGVLKEFALDA